MALFLGIRSGIRDARNGKEPFFWSALTHPENRKALIKDGWKDIARLFVLALVLDMLVQWIMFKWIYPGGALLVAFFITIVVYVSVRGPTTRIIRRVKQRRKKSIYHDEAA